MRQIAQLVSAALAAAIMALHGLAYAESVPFWGAKASVSIDTPIDQLKHGQFLWMGGAVTTGPVVMVVSLNEQRAYVYRNGVLIGATSVSTGRPGHLTPTGVFTVLQKQKEHRSTIYDGAPMPYMERLTWGGIALHAGGLPGYPESHGCVHLPSDFAQLLFGVSPMGMTVVIANEATQPKPVAHPGYLAPVSFHGRQPIQRNSLGPAETERWQPDLSPTGPVSIVLSGGSHRVIVYRNGVEIGRARLEIVGDQPLISHTLVLTEGPSDTPNPYVPDPRRYHWLLLAEPGDMQNAGKQLTAAAFARIRLPAEFVSQVNSILTLGTTVLVTPESLSPESSGPAVQVLDADPPSGERYSKPQATRR